MVEEIRLCLRPGDLLSVTDGVKGRVSSTCYLYSLIIYFLSRLNFNFNPTRLKIKDETLNDGSPESRSSNQRDS